MLARILIFFALIPNTSFGTDCNIPKPKPKVVVKKSPCCSLGVSPEVIENVNTNTVTVNNQLPSIESSAKTKTVVRYVRVPDGKVNHIGMMIGSFQTGAKVTETCCKMTFSQYPEMDFGAYYIREFGNVDLGGFYTSKKNFGGMFGVGF